MALMEKIRSGSDGPVIQVIMGVVLVSFILWGYGAKQGGNTTVATVNGQDISSIEYGRVLRNAEQAQNRQRSAVMTDDERAQLRERVLQDLIQRHALVQEAQRLGLAVSDVEVADVLLDQGFTKPDGSFDREGFENYLRYTGYTRGDFEANMREDLLVSKLRELAILGATVSEPVVRQQFIDEQTKVDIAYVRIRPGALFSQAKPDDATLEAWASTHEAEIQARYDRDRSLRYDKPEQIDAHVVVFKAGGDEAHSLAQLKARMNDVRERIAGGEDFEDVARAVSEDPSAPQGGLLTAVRTIDLDPTAKTALASLEPGALTGVLVTDRDVRLYRLDAREDAHVVPLADVRTEIAQSLYEATEAPRIAAELAEQTLLPAWKAEGTAPEALLTEYLLSVDQTGPISIYDTEEGVLFRPPQKMVTAAAAARPGEVLPEVYEDGGILWIGQLTSRQDADLSLYQAQHEQFREMALLRRRAAFYQDWVSDLVARAKVERYAVDLR